MNISVWLYILLAAAVSYGLRIIPIFFKERLTRIENSKFVIFLNYVSCAIIGSTIYVVAFGEDKPSFHVTYMDLIKILILIISFIINLRLKRPIITFTLCIILYAALSFMADYV